MKWLVFVVAFLFMALPAQAFADDGAKDSGAIIRIRGDVVVPAGETLDSVVVVNGNASIQGTVRNNVVVVKGDAVVSGKIEGNLTVVSGNIRLDSGAAVHNVNSIRGDLNRSPEANVTGRINERDNFGVARGVAAVFSILFWAGMTVAAVVAGLVFAAVGGRQLTESAKAMTGDAVGTIVGLVFLWVALPIIAVLAMATLIGLPLGLGLLFFLMPALWFLGYIVAGARLGGFITGLAGRGAGVHPFAATSVGALLLQFAIIVPVLGILVAFLAGIWGAGALVYVAYRAAGGKSLGATPSPAGSQPLPAA